MCIHKSFSYQPTVVTQGSKPCTMACAVPTYSTCSSRIVCYIWFKFIIYSLWNVLNFVWLHLEASANFRHKLFSSYPLRFPSVSATCEADLGQIERRSCVFATVRGHLQRAPCVCLRLTATMLFTSPPPTTASPSQLCSCSCSSAPTAPTNTFPTTPKGS
jgi:hypothetical protein